MFGAPPMWVPPDARDEYERLKAGAYVCPVCDVWGCAPEGAVQECWMCGGVITKDPECRWPGAASGGGYQSFEWEKDAEWMALMDEARDAVY